MDAHEIAEQAQDEMWDAAVEARPAGGPTPRQIELIARRLCVRAGEQWPRDAREASLLIAVLGATDDQ